MKHFKKFAVTTIAALVVLVSCGNPVTGMWIEEVTDADSVEGYWITFEEDNTFKYTVLSGAHSISVYYVGTYEVDKGANTITLTATEETDGSEDGSNYSWTDSTWTQTISYTTEGGKLILTLENSSTITLVTRDQPIEMQRAIGL